MLVVWRWELAVCRNVDDKTRASPAFIALQVAGRRFHYVAPSLHNPTYFPAGTITGRKPTSSAAIYGGLRNRLAARHAAAT